jgi:hypothetical protein
MRCATRRRARVLSTADHQYLHACEVSCDVIYYVIAVRARRMVRISFYHNLDNRSISDPYTYALFCLQSHILSFPKVLQIPPESSCIFLSVINCLSIDEVSNLRGPESSSTTAVRIQNFARSGPARFRTNVKYVHPTTGHQRPRRGLEVSLILNLGARKGWVASTPPRPLYPRERPETHCTGGRVGPRAGLDVCEKYRLHRDFFPLV